MPPGGCVTVDHPVGGAGIRAHRPHSPVRLDVAGQSVRELGSVECGIDVSVVPGQRKPFRNEFQDPLGELPFLPLRLPVYPVGIAPRIDWGGKGQEQQS